MFAKSKAFVLPNRFWREGGIHIWNFGYRLYPSFLPSHSSWRYSNCYMFFRCVYTHVPLPTVSSGYPTLVYLGSLLKTEMAGLHILTFWFNKIGCESSISTSNKHLRWRDGCYFAATHHPFPDLKSTQFSLGELPFPCWAWSWWVGSFKHSHPQKPNPFPINWFSQRIGMWTKPH